MLFGALLLGLMLLGSGGLGYVVGKGRRSEFEKTRDREYKEAVKALDSRRDSALESDRKVLVYERALGKIAKGDDRMPDITASLALGEFN